MKLKKLLKIEYQKLLVAKSQITLQLRKMPDGSLQFHVNGNQKKWFRVSPGKPRVYIKKSKRELAELLALKEHLLNNLSAIEQNLVYIDALLQKTPDYPVPLSFYKENLRELLAPNHESNIKWKEEWLLQPYQRNQDHPESLIVPTKAGIYVRSKSEAMIANELFENNIPFHYEQKLTLNEMSLYPDFTIPGKKTGETIIWEHFGMADNAHYLVGVNSKIKQYLDAGFIPGVNLIMTFENKSCPLDISYVNLMITYHFGDDF